MYRAQPAQPSPASQQVSRALLMIFLSNCSSKIRGEHEMMLSQNRNNKLFSYQRCTKNVWKMLVLFSCFFAIKFHDFIQSEMVIQISKATFPLRIHHPFLMKIYDFSMKFDDFDDFWWKFMIFRWNFAVRKKKAIIFSFFFRQRYAVNTKWCCPKICSYAQLRVLVHYELPKTQ